MGPQTLQINDSALKEQFIAVLRGLLLGPHSPVVDLHLLMVFAHVIKFCSYSLTIVMVSKGLRSNEDFVASLDWFSFTDSQIVNTIQNQNVLLLLYYIIIMMPK